jgi:echinoderm microtubule-associated protein-like 6
MAASAASVRFSPTRPLSPVNDGNSLAQEVEKELKFQGDLAKQNRDRVEAMRAQLRKFQQLTATNAKEIKSLRAERFKLLQTEADAVNASLEEELMQQEDEARESFAKKTFVVPHQDLPDVGAGAKGGVVSAAAERTADSEHRAKDELYPASDPDSDVESLCGHRGMLELAALNAREEASFLKVKTYRGSLFGPDNEQHMQFERESHLQPILQRVAGCSVRGRSSNVFWLASRRVVYTSGSIAVVAEWQAASTVEQEFFTMHSEEIGAMCVHPNGTTVASGEQAATPAIYVWDSNEMEVLGPAITGFHTRGIACLAFSKDGMLLFSVGRDTSHCIAAHDWKTGQLICSERADPRRRVLDMRCNPHDGLLVTVGVRHIKFWSLSLGLGTEALATAPPISVWQQRLEPKRGVFGRHGVSKSHTLLCVEFGGPGVTITGSRDGSLLIWKGVALVSWLQAHAGPVFSLWAIPAQGQTKLCSGGKDGAVGVWMFDSSLHLLYKPMVLPKEHKACIRSVCWHETMGEIVLATADSKILLLSPDPERSMEPPRLLQRGHRGGPMRALAVSPVNETFVTGGADGRMLLWDSETGFVLSECKLPHGITCACYHKDGNKIAVCMEVGGGVLVSQTPQRKLALTSYKFCELVKCELSLAKYSPDSDMLVVGYRSKFEIYNAESLKSKIGGLVGHVGQVMHVDWSTDGRYLVSTSDAYELIFWDRFTGKPILSSSVANFAKPGHETTWATWTCNLGWPVQGIAASGPDEFFVTSVARDSSSTLMLTGDASGGVNLCPYPCPGTFYPVSPPRLHVGPVAHALFLGRPEDVSTGAKEGSIIVSLGSADGNILIWRLEKAVPRFDVVEEEVEDQDTGKLAPEIERLVQESRAKPRVLDDVVKVGVDQDTFESVKPYLLSVCPPTIKVVPPEVFEWRLELQYLHGFQGSYGRASAFVSASGEMVYAAGATCVLQVPDSLVTDESKRINPQIQRHFTQHTDHIHCMACHPRGDVVASSDGQPNGTILVWKIHTLEVAARLPAVDESNAALLAFSNDGSMLVSVSNEKKHTVSVWDWSAQLLLVSEDGDYEPSNRILSVAVDPFAPAPGRDVATTFITCGVNHVKFWTLERHTKGGYMLRSQRGLMEDEEASRIQLCARGTLDAKFVTGTDTGELVLWKGHRIVHTVRAHAGPVFALAENRETQHLCSGSNDCCVKVWGGGLQLLKVIELRELLENTFLDRNSGPSIRTLDWNGSLDRYLVGTAAGEVFDFFKKDDEYCIEFLANGHSAGQIQALSAHPSKLLVASGGEDKTIRIWELGDTPALYRVLNTRSIITALEFSPGEGTMLAVGHDNGSIRILDVSLVIEEKGQMPGGHLNRPVPYDTVLSSAQPASKRKVAIEVLRFSPDGCYLASGCPDSVIDIFSVSEAFKHVGTCKGHAGAISQLDFDSTGNYLQSNTWSDELKYWDVPSCAENRRATDLCDSEWATFTCRLAWHVLASVTPGNESSVRSISRQRGKDPYVFAVGYGSGELKLMPFPAPEADFTGISQQSSCRAINHVCYSCDNAFLIVAGGPVPVIEIYRHFEVQHIASDDSDVREIVNSRRPKPPSHAHAASEEAQMSSVKPYVGAVFPPTIEPFICPVSAFPNFRLSLEHVQSFRGHDTRHCLFFTAAGAIAFMACGMIVIQDGNETRETPRQRHFCEHKGELTCASLHPDGTIIASAERGPNSVILVWDSADFDESKKKFKVKASLAGVLVQGKMQADAVGISHVCFGGPGSKFLFSLGLSDESVLSVYEWQASMLLSHVAVKSSRVLDLACNPVDHTLVTCGVRHLKFWSIKNDGAKLVPENAFYGDRVVPRTMCSVCFLALGAYSLAVTGSIDGCLLLWQKERLLHIVKEAHTGSIFDLAFDRANFLLYSAGRDGTLRLWSVDDHSGMLSPTISREKCPVMQSTWCRSPKNSQSSTP